MQALDTVVFEGLESYDTCHPVARYIHHHQYVRDATQHITHKQKKQGLNYCPFRCRDWTTRWSNKLCGASQHLNYQHHSSRVYIDTVLVDGPHRSRPGRNVHLEHEEIELGDISVGTRRQVRHRSQKIDSFWHLRAFSTRTLSKSITAFIS